MANILQIHDPADPSVGLFPTTWEIEVPFLISKDKEKRQDQMSDIEFFRELIIDAYGSFCDGKVQAVYDFENEEMVARYEEYERDNPKDEEEE